jgi:hypothetical protein
MMYDQTTTLAPEKAKGKAAAQADYERRILSALTPEAGQ